MRVWVLQDEPSQRCSINKVSYMDPQYEVLVDWQGQSLLLQVNATQLQPAPGDNYYLQIHPYGIFVLTDAP